MRLDIRGREEREQRGEGEEGKAKPGMATSGEGRSKRSGFPSTTEKMLNLPAGGLAAHLAKTPRFSSGFGFDLDPSLRLLQLSSPLQPRSSGERERSFSFPAPPPSSPVTRRTRSHTGMVGGGRGQEEGRQQDEVLLDVTPGGGESKVEEGVKSKDLQTVVQALSPFAVEEERLLGQAAGLQHVSRDGEASKKEEEVRPKTGQVKREEEGVPPTGGEEKEDEGVRPSEEEEGPVSALSPNTRRFRSRQRRASVDLGVADLSSELGKEEKVDWSEIEVSGEKT